MTTLNPRLKTLRPEVLQALTDYYRETAEDCATIERIKSGRAEARARAARQAAIIDAAGMVETYAAGMGLDAAVRAVARVTGLPIETIAANVRLARRRSSDRYRILRDRRIMRLARRGWSNPEIARRVALHPNTVSKIVQRELRAAADPQAPGQKPHIREASQGQPTPACKSGGSPGRWNLA